MPSSDNRRTSRAPRSRCFLIPRWGRAELRPSILIWIFIEMYGEAAAAQGMTIPEYVAQLQVFPEDQMKHKYRHKQPLVRPNEVNHLPTKMRRLHNWYMKESAKSENWIYFHHKNECYEHGNDMVMIEFVELYQLYQMDDLDKSILSAYCL